MMPTAVPISAGNATACREKKTLLVKSAPLSCSFLIGIRVCCGLHGVHSKGKALHELCQALNDSDASPERTSRPSALEPLAFMLGNCQAADCEGMGSDSVMPLQPSARVFLCTSGRALACAPSVCPVFDITSCCHLTGNKPQPEILLPSCRQFTVSNYAFSFASVRNLPRENDFAYGRNRF